jgi:hypothetical protein
MNAVTLLYTTVRRTLKSAGGELLLTPKPRQIPATLFILRRQAPNHQRAKRTHFLWQRTQNYLSIISISFPMER